MEHLTPVMGYQCSGCEPSPRLLLDKNSNLPRTRTTRLRVYHDGIRISIFVDSSEDHSAQGGFIGAAYSIWIRISPYDLVAELVHEHVLLSFCRKPGMVDGHCNLLKRIFPPSNQLQQFEASTRSDEAAFITDLYSTYHDDKVTHVKAGPHDWYILLRWLPKDGQFEGFMLTGREARAEVQRGESFQKKRIAEGTRKKVFPSINVGPKVARRADRWREKWKSWSL